MNNIFLIKEAAVFLYSHPKGSSKLYRKNL